MTSQVPEYGGCEWPVDAACFTEEWDSYSPEIKSRALGLASSTLARLTGYRVGNCPITVRPCKPKRAMCTSGHDILDYYSPAFTPTLWAGAWINSCGCLGTCGCTTACEVELPGPVGRIDEVKIDGDIVNPANYRVDNGNLLVWQGTGDCPWPAEQNLAKPDTEEGTFSITYLNAYPVDALGAYAAGVLAVEYGRACGGGSCRLPVGVTTIVRQGLTMEIASGAFPGGLTGIREVDTFISLWNPRAMTQTSTVWSPNSQRVRRTTA